MQVELDVSGPHNNLEGKIPVTLGTIPLASTQPTNPVPYTDVPPQPIQDPSLAPTQPVSPASPPPVPNDAGLPGWNMGNLYPTIRKISNHFVIQLKAIGTRCHYNSIISFISATVVRRIWIQGQHCRQEWFSAHPCRARPKWIRSQISNVHRYRASTASKFQINFCTIINDT